MAATTDEVVRRLNELPTVLPQEAIMQMRESIARIEVRIEQAIALSDDVSDLQTRVTQIEAWTTFATWIGGALFSLLAAAVGAGWLVQ